MLICVMVISPYLGFFVIFLTQVSSVETMSRNFYFWNFEFLFVAKLLCNTSVGFPRDQEWLEFAGVRAHRQLQRPLLLPFISLP